jgi:hypothetical protein
MKKTKWALAAFVVALSFFGCSDSGGDDDSDPIWLADVSNPLIGEWKSEAASDGTRLTFIGKTDGSFQYVMEGVPAEMGLPETGTGGYLVMDKVIVSYFDFGLVKSTIFKVVDNNTVAMTEFTLDETGQKVLGEITNFHRIGEAVFNEYQPMFLPTNIFIGKKWSANIPDGENPGISYPSTWEFNQNGRVLVTFLGIGAALGFTSEDAFYTFAWVILNGKLIMFTESQEGNQIETFKFTPVNANTINLSELEIVNGFINETGGVAVPFTAISDNSFVGTWGSTRDDGVSRKISMKSDLP